VISIPAYTLNDGSTLPALGLGTWPMTDDEAERVTFDDSTCRN
jgi:diketogulonate reductase-like aldo/keto reductase